MGIYIQVLRWLADNPGDLRHNPDVLGPWTLSEVRVWRLSAPRVLPACDLPALSFSQLPAVVPPGANVPRVLARVPLEAA